MTKGHAKCAKEAHDYTATAGLSSARLSRDLEEMKQLSKEAIRTLKEGRKR
jgi:hypothetical protein